MQVEVDHGKVRSAQPSDKRDESLPRHTVTHNRERSSEQRVDQTCLPAMSPPADEAGVSKAKRALANGVAIACASRTACTARLWTVQDATDFWKYALAFAGGHDVGHRLGYYQYHGAMVGLTILKWNFLSQHVQKTGIGFQNKIIHLGR